MVNMLSLRPFYIYNLRSEQYINKQMHIIELPTTKHKLNSPSM